jgi:tetratricopeptide (TPR) repeat protein
VAGLVAIFGGMGAAWRWLRPALSNLAGRRSEPTSAGSQPYAQLFADASTTATPRDAETLKERGKLLRNSGKTTEAQRYFDAAFDIFERYGDSRGQANARMNRGINFRRAGEYGKAIEDHKQAHRLYGLRKDLRGQADNLKNLGQVYRDDRQIQRTIKIHELALRLYGDDSAGRAALFHELGIDYGLVGDTKRAEECFNSSERERARGR